MNAMLSGSLVTTSWPVMASRYGGWLPIQEQAVGVSQQIGEKRREGAGVQLVSLAGGKQFLAIKSVILHNITKGTGR